MYMVRYNTSYSVYIVHSTRGQEREKEIVEATLTQLPGYGPQLMGVKLGENLNNPQKLPP